jgi:hypothetical protein
MNRKAVQAADMLCIQEFKKYQEIPDTTIEALKDFMYWYENDYDFGDWSEEEIGRASCRERV